MNAKDARRLEVGDEVIVAFGTSHRKAWITHIRWPKFIVRTILANGQERTQASRYTALYAEADYVRTYGDYNH